MKMLEDKKFTYILLSLIGLLHFVRLDFGEVQQWDEALYAMRAKSIVYFNDWIDQTPHAVGGFYSSAHPPLFIWLIALTYKLFGISTMTTRLWSAIFGTGIIFLIYFIGREVYDRRVGLIAGVLLGTNPLFSFYSRQGQPDVTYIFFISLSFYFYLRYFNSKRLSLLVLSGCTLGLSLMSKSLVGLFGPIIILAFMILLFTFSQAPAKHFVRNFLILSSITLLLGLPWYFYMGYHHSTNSFYGSFFSHLVQSLEGLTKGLGTNVKELGYLYFINQLLVRFPLSILAAYFLLFQGIMNFKTKRFQGENSQHLFVIVWFTVFFVVFTLLRTKVISYTLPMLVPISLLVGNVIMEIHPDNYRDKQKTLAGMFSFTGIVLLWSSWEDVRLAAKSFAKSMASFSSPSPSDIGYTFAFLASGFVIVLLAFWVVRTEKWKLIINKLPHTIILSAVVIFGFQIIFIDEQKYTDGAQQVASVLNAHHYHHIVYLYTPHYTGGMNPQLAFYLDGVNAGWSTKKTFTQIPRENTDKIQDFLSKGKDFQKETFVIIVEKAEEDLTNYSPDLKDAEKSILTKLKKQLETKRYIVYGPA